LAYQCRVGDYRWRGGGPAEDGTTDFSVLQNELKGRSNKIVMVAFDLLYLNGYDLRKLPLFEHKTLRHRSASAGLFGAGSC
jgi:hypothetical protein